MQDQAFLGLESGARTARQRRQGVELFISTQWLHDDRRQIAECLGLPEERVRLQLAGVGGAFGAREDVSLQVHVCLLALRTGRPVKMMYGRDESFLGHVHRHPGRIWMRHHARADGTLVNLECRVILDGGAYASTSSAVLINAITHVQGPYRLPNARIDGWAVRTNNPPCGAMRGFGVQQACFAHESQMDKLAAACGLDPVEIRLRNAIETGDPLVTGQRARERGSDGPLPEGDRRAAAATCSRRPRMARPTRRRGAHGRRVAREARCRLRARDQEPHVLRGLRRLRDRAVPAGRRRRLAQARNRRSRPGLRHDRGADRPRHPRRRRSRARTGGHLDRVSGVDVRVATDLDVGRGDRHGVPGRARAPVRARRGGARRRPGAPRDRGHRGGRHRRRIARVGRGRDRTASCWRRP